MEYLRRDAFEFVGFRHRPSAPGAVAKMVTDRHRIGGFVAGIAASCAIVFASGTGMPVSTTHAVVGAVLGVDMARGRETIDLRRRVCSRWNSELTSAAVDLIRLNLVLRPVI